MYIVWKQDPYSDHWYRHDCASDRELEGKILELIKEPGEIQVTEPRGYKVNVKITEAPAFIDGGKLKNPWPTVSQRETEVKVEASQDRSAKDKGSGSKSHKPDGPGDRTGV